MSPHRLITLACLLLLMGCASTPSKSYPLPPPTDLLEVSPDSAWHRILGLVRERGWSVALSDREGGILTTDWLAANDPDRWMDCGNPGLLRIDVGHQGKVTFALRSAASGPRAQPRSVEASGDGAVLGAEAAASGTRVDVDVVWTVRRRGVDDVVRTQSCVSRGTLEREIHDDLRTAPGT
jgi:hypothetical protein